MHPLLTQPLPRPARWSCGWNDGPPHGDVGGPFAFGRSVPTARRLSQRAVDEHDSIGLVAATSTSGVPGLSSTLHVVGQRENPVDIMRRLAKCSRAFPDSVQENF